MPMSTSTENESMQPSLSKNLISGALADSFKSKTKPWKHQVDGYKFLIDHDAAMIAWEMGCGKSKIVVDFIVNLHIKHTLIVCPLSVCSVWPQQFKLHAAEDVEVLCLDRGLVTKKLKIIKRAIEVADIQNKSIVIVINYESIWPEPLGSWICSRPWDLVVLDESHRIKAPGSKVSWFFKRLRINAARRICLTGTPMPHSPLDVYAQYRFLDPNIYDRSFQFFKLRYAILGGRGRLAGRIITGFRNLNDLHKKFYIIGHRVTKDEVLDLPETMDVERTCELKPKTRNLYRQMEKEFMVWLSETELVTAQNALVKLLRLQQLASGYLGGINEDQKEQKVGSEKERLLQGILEDLPDTEKVVVFAIFRHDLDRIHTVAERLERKSFEISGRIKQLEEWKAHDKGGIIAVQTRAGGLGIDLSKACYAIYYSLGFSLGDHQQSKARLHRPGQTRKVTYIHLITKDTVDEKILCALKGRENIIMKVLEGYRYEKHDTKGIKRIQNEN